MRRVMALNGRDVKTCIMLARTIAALQAEKKIEQAQGFLALIWNQWRDKDDRPENFPTESIEQFFDFYFQTHGDFARIDAMLTASIPAENKEECLAEVETVTRKTLKLLRDSQFVNEVQIVATPQPAAGELLN
jgi:hypothetical protein